jgi:hypothetical protein
LHPNEISAVLSHNKVQVSARKLCSQAGQNARREQKASSSMQNVAAVCGESASTALATVCQVLDETMRRATQLLLDCCSAVHENELSVEARLQLLQVHQVTVQFMLAGVSVVAPNSLKQHNLAEDFPAPITPPPATGTQPAEHALQCPTMQHQSARLQPSAELEYCMMRSAPQQRHSFDLKNGIAGKRASAWRAGPLLPTVVEEEHEPPSVPDEHLQATSMVSHTSDPFW